MFVKPQEVNTIWAGLGYYRRAQFLLEVFPFDPHLIVAFPEISNSVVPRSLWFTV